MIGIVIAATAGIALALVVVRVGVRQTAARSAYVDQPEYAVWGGLVLLQIPIWAVLGVISAWWATEIRSLPPENDRPPWHIFVAWLGAALLLGALFLIQALAMHLEYPREYPDGFRVRIVAMGGVVALAAALPAVALWGLLRAAIGIDPADRRAAERFSVLWSRQRDFLGILGVMLALTILTTAAKLEANNGFTPPEGSPLPDVPSTFVFVVGAVYGAILLAIYLPPYYGTRRVGLRLVDGWCGVGTGEDGTCLDTRKDRQRYRTEMGLDESTRQHFERGAILIAPLLTALVTTLLPGINT